MKAVDIQADIHKLYESSFYRVLDFRCRCDDCSRSKPEYKKSFSISFIRSGNFYYDVFRNSYDAHTGKIIVSKPYHEHTIQHTKAPPDKCTIFDFKESFYNQLVESYQLTHAWFFNNPDVHAIMVKTSPETEYLHAAFVEKIFSEQLTRLLADELMMELVSSVMNVLSPLPEEKISGQLKKNHLKTIESAKEFLHQHFTRDVSLEELANHCFVSLFHFSRIFKAICDYSPHQYLTSLRLKHAEVLLRSTSLPITDVCFQSGFNNLEHFSYAFRKQYHASPSGFRKNKIPAAVHSKKINSVSL